MHRPRGLAAPVEVRLGDAVCEEGDSNSRYDHGFTLTAQIHVSCSVSCRAQRCLSSGCDDPTVTA